MKTFPNLLQGKAPAIAGEDLTGKEGYLVMITDDGDGNPVATLPAAATDIPRHMLYDGAGAGEPVVLEPLSDDTQMQVKMKGAGSIGDNLVLADPATAADAGMLIADPETAESSVVFIARAEVDFVDGQLAEVRPFGPMPFTHPAA